MAQPPTTAKKKANRTPTPTDPRQAFVFLAKRRVNRAIATIQSVAPLANKRNYTFAKDDVDKIEKALTDAVKALRTRFNAALEGVALPAGGGFSL